MPQKPLYMYTGLLPGVGIGLLWAINNGAVIQWVKGARMSQGVQNQSVYNLPITMKSRGIWVTSLDCNDSSPSHTVSGYIHTTTFAQICLNHNAAVTGYINAIIIGKV